MWFAVFIEPLIPEAGRGTIVGPYRLEWKAKGIADDWNNQHPDRFAYVITMMTMTVGLDGKIMTTIPMKEE